MIQFWLILWRVPKDQRMLEFSLKSDSGQKNINSLCHLNFTKEVIFAYLSTKIADISKTLQLQIEKWKLTLPCYNRGFTGPNYSPLFPVIGLRNSVYYRAAITRWRHLFQSKINFSYQILELCYFVYPNSNN